jgi:type II secretory pathway pseudopilin PulG
MKKLNQKAFAPVEVLVVVLIMIVVAFIGYSAYQRANNTNQGSESNQEANATGYKTLVYGQQIGAIVQGCRAGSTVNSGVKIRMKGILTRGNRPTNTYASVWLEQPSSPYRHLSAIKLFYPNSQGSWVSKPPIRPSNTQSTNANPVVVAYLYGRDANGTQHRYPSADFRYRSLPRC